MVGKDWQAQPNAHAGLAFKEMLTKVLQTWRSIWRLRTRAADRPNLKAKHERPGRGFAQVHPVVFSTARGQAGRAAQGHAGPRCWPARRMRVPLRVFIIRVPYYTGDCNRVPNLENYPFVSHCSLSLSRCVASGCTEAQGEVSQIRPKLHRPVHMEELRTRFRHCSHIYIYIYIYIYFLQTAPHLESQLTSQQKASNDQFSLAI